MLPDKQSIQPIIRRPAWRHLPALALALLLLACFGTVNAAPSSAACREAQTTLDALSVDLERLAQRHQQLLALRQDTLPADVALTDLLTVDLSDDRAVQMRLQQPARTDRLDDWPDNIDCRELATRYQEALDEGRWLVRAIEREKTAVAQPAASAAQRHGQPVAITPGTAPRI